MELLVKETEKRIKWRLQTFTKLFFFISSFDFSDYSAKIEKKTEQDQNIYT